ncbi:PLD nuclease N-terminal domain-containing protein [Gymnodinialimonas ceratoperidinii]|uniref:PLD nuclease N-terminal domain-containing protein n=1 Tax=Gymnodinialimonas ceratoperidinii TaxID=2856823 RepID=A0A8F6TX48_9RHOB|nr:PLD nuclease N-terminal domain-containing protein [Gymnodinialimonas ceratoperidinii]QXT40556.1 PLD nuclease N-terminal domain-containing protein [Gymnodinialimonas ceratoperidinii]
MEYGIFGLLVLIADIYAIFKTWTSSASTLAKVIWTIVILVLPILGFIAWLVAGPKGGNTLNV